VNGTERWGDNGVMMFHGLVGGRFGGVLHHDLTLINIMMMIS
jgi:hypothetical protein